MMEDWGEVDAFPTKTRPCPHRETYVARAMDIRCVSCGQHCRKINTDPHEQLVTLLQKVNALRVTPGVTMKKRDAEIHNEAIEATRALIEEEMHR